MSKVECYQNVWDTIADIILSGFRFTPPHHKLLKCLIIFY
ncbi:Uncharacterised protein [Legionella wadsworthii]|uniref:Uncharacterized protein n=1 Tax=Legionella wadsworthii TaxID=28088 RepID=A0A378LXV8_9GAMM|nr:Uncharacterised protein [Legionella wadsworthii]